MMSAHVAHAPTESTLQKSPWHSPVPYLFGGLAAMLGLIAFALLILACSYWKLSGYLEDDNENSPGERDLEMGDSDEKPKQLPPVYEEKILVIMAGQVKPTFLATPISSRASSFGTNSSGGEVADKPDGDGEVSEKTKVGSGGGGGGGDDQVQVGNTENRETSNQVP